MLNVNDTNIFWAHTYE